MKSAFVFTDGSTMDILCYIMWWLSRYGPIAGTSKTRSFDVIADGETPVLPITDTKKRDGTATVLPEAASAYIRNNIDLSRRPDYTLPRSATAAAVEERGERPLL